LTYGFGGSNNPVIQVLIYELALPAVDENGRHPFAFTIYFTIITLSLRLPISICNHASPSPASIASTA